MFEITPELSFIATKMSVGLVLSWPPNRNASTKEKIIFEIKWWISWINSLLLSIPLAYAAYNDRKDIMLFTKSLCLALSCAQCSIKMLICRLYRARMQVVLEEMENYVRNAESWKRDIFLKYTKKCGLIHFCFLIYAILTTVGMILGPLILQQKFPTDAKYPFNVNEHPIFDIIYIQQSIVGMQVSSMTAMDGQMALMLWCIISRLKILQIQMKRMTNANEFTVCVKEHQYLLELGKEVINIIHYIILTTVIMATMTIILGGIHIVGHEPIIIRAQFTFVAVGFCTILFLTAYPAEMLLEASQDVGLAIYESEWENSNFNKNVVFVIQRSGNPLIISATGLIPTLSLNYYSLFLSKALSFFTTLRVLLLKMDLDG